MKKILLATALILMSTHVYAVNPNCKYTQDQQIVRDAEYIADMEVLGADKKRINAHNSCGGTLLQLATLRGNIDVIQYLLMNGADTETLVSIKGYEADFNEDTPDEIPLIMWAARYAQHGEIFQVFLNHEINAFVKDSEDHDIYWYFEQNPVLRNSYLTKAGDKELISYAKKFGSAKPLPDNFE